MRLFERIRTVLYEVKYACQRVVRGWDDKVVIGGIPDFLCRNMPLWLREVKEYGHPPMHHYSTVSTEYSDVEQEAARARWNRQLDIMIRGFEAGQVLLDASDMDNDEAHMEALEKAFDVMKTEFLSLYT